ncbi:hypothetical protein EKG38_10735 [Shewanella canadensis]|uniref:Caspase family protein n=1 Tax=Shewanella canadensis TaxID=271096 RepID=A0A431WSH7_9GAMM|nr:caspase family protein [Shewanella canadensis]RTR38648.1 hypothetical protein EKG38_10735 [Shewanella canadensis]
MKNITITCVIALSGCAYQSSGEDIVSTTPLPLSPIPLKIEVDNYSTQILNGVFTLTPEMTGIYQEYLKTKGYSTVIQNDFNALSAFGLTLWGVTTAGIGLVALATDDGPSDACWVYDCQSTKENEFTRIEKGKSITDKLKFRPGEIVIDFKDGKNVLQSIPLDSSGSASITLMELGYPDEISINLSFKGLLKDVAVSGNNEKFEVPKQVTAIGSEVINSTFYIDQFSLSNKVGDFSEGYIKEVVSNRDSYIESLQDSLIPISFPHSYTIPEIKKPKLLPLPELKKERFETTDEFKLRASDALEVRNIHVEQVKKAFKYQVDERNKIVTIDNEFIKKAAGDIVRVSRLRIKENQSFDIERLKEQVIYAFRNVVGNTYLDNLSYDADNSMLYGVIKSTGSDYSESIRSLVPRDVAKNIFESPSIANVRLDFGISNPNEISLNNINLFVLGERYNAVVTDETYKNNSVYFKVTPRKLEWNMEQLISDKPDEVVLAGLQSANLVDAKSVNLRTYIRGSVLNSSEVNFVDDIPELLKISERVRKQTNKWLIVVGIERYDNAQDIIFAKRSASLFKKVVQSKFGVTEQNTLTLFDEDATAGAIKGSIGLILDKVKKGDTIYFYYNGHGIPNPTQDSEPYILPSDSFPSFVSEDDGLMLKSLYSKLSNSKASQVIVFVDSCFSGMTDGMPLLPDVAASRLVPKRVEFNEKKMVVITAGRKDQFSNAFYERGNRLFSYYVMKYILTQEGTVNDLFDVVRTNVVKESKLLGGVKKQEPSLQGNGLIRL